MLSTTASVLLAVLACAVKKSAGLSVILGLLRYVRTERFPNVLVCMLFMSQ